MLNLAYADLIDGHSPDVVAELDEILTRPDAEHTRIAQEERMAAILATGGEVAEL